MIDNKTYGVRTGSHTAATSPASISMVNLVEGVVHSQHVGLLHTMVRIHAGRRVDLRIRLPLADERCFFPGQPVIAMIPAEAVRLEAGFFRRSRQRLNRWYGRIVLIKRVDEGQLLTAKLHREGWTPHQYEAGLGICSFSSNLGSRHYRRRSRKDRLGPSSTRGPDRAKGPFPLQACLPTGEIVSVTSVSTIKKGACMTVSSRLLFITLVGFLGYSSFVMTDSLRAQEIKGLEAAQNTQPAPTNMSPEESRKHLLNCPGGPSTQFRLGGKVKNPKTFNLDTLRGQPTQTTVWAFYRSGSSPTGFEPCFSKPRSR